MLKGRGFHLVEINNPPRHFKVIDALNNTKALSFELVFEWLSEQ